jgi:hypothetical protein
MTLRSGLLIAATWAALGCSGSSDGGGTETPGGGSGGAAQAGSAGGCSGGSAGSSSGGASSGGTSNGGRPGSGGASAGSSSGGRGGATGAACRVGDVVYPDGTGDFQDPFSCNMCSCLDGALACTRIGCPIECPAGTSAGTSCDQCGPAGGCEVVFHGCLAQCARATDCEDGTCVDQTCKTLCR